MWYRWTWLIAEAIGKKIEAMAEAQDLFIAPHVSIGPVALCAALHFDWSTPNVLIQENFAEYDVPWRNDLVCGWNPVQKGEFLLPTVQVSGSRDTNVCAEHPYKENSFPSLWDEQWVQGFAQSKLKFSE